MNALKFYTNEYGVFPFRNSPFYNKPVPAIAFDESDIESIQENLIDFESGEWVDMEYFVKWHLAYKFVSGRWHESIHDVTLFDSFHLDQYGMSGIMTFTHKWKEFRMTNEEIRVETLILPDFSLVFDGLRQFLEFIHSQVAERNADYIWANMPTLKLIDNYSVMYGCMVHYEHVIIALNGSAILFWATPNTTDVYSVEEIAEQYQQNYVERRVMRIVNGLLKG